MLLVYLQKLIQLVKDLGTVVIIMNDDYMKELKYGEEEILFISGKKVFKEYYDNHLGEKDSLFFDGKI